MIKTKATSRFLQVGFYSLVTLFVFGIIGGITYMVRAGGSALPVSGQAPGFHATNIPSGQSVSLHTLNGKIFLITWYYTHCTDECPLTMYRFEQVQEQLEKEGTFGKKVVLVAMTLDPARDTRPVILKYAARYHANFSGWYFLRANPSQTFSILKTWGVEEKPSTDKEFIEHTLKTELVDENGNVRAVYNTANLDPKQIVSDINNLVSHME